MLTDFDQKNKKVSMKPMDLSCLLRLSKSMLQENAFKDAAIEFVYRLVIECLAVEAHRLSFPDMSLLPVLQIKQFLKKCKANKYTNKLRGAMNKIQENMRFIEAERRKVSFNLSDKKIIEAWEKTIQVKGTPLETFCKQLQKIYEHQEAKRITDNDKVGEFRIPALKKGEKRRNKADGPVLDLPSSDDSEDEDALIRFAGENDSEDQSNKKKLKQESEDQSNKKKFKQESKDEKPKKKKKKKTSTSKVTPKSLNGGSCNKDDSDSDIPNLVADDDIVDFKFSDSE